jgi:hypothetical protein
MEVLCKDYSFRPYQLTNMAPQSSLVSYWLISKTAFPLKPNDMKLGKKHLWKILYRDYSFRFDPFTNMAATGNSCFRLVNF